MIYIIASWPVEFFPEIFLRLQIAGERSATSESDKSYSFPDVERMRILYRWWPVRGLRVQQTRPNGSIGDILSVRSGKLWPGRFVSFFHKSRESRRLVLGVARAIVGENDDARGGPARGKPDLDGAAESPAVIAMCRVLDDTCFRLAVEIQQRNRHLVRTGRRLGRCVKLETNDGRVRVLFLVAIEERERWD